jgi:hypothetical protein
MRSARLRSRAGAIEEAWLRAACGAYQNGLVVRALKLQIPVLFICVHLWFPILSCGIVRIRRRLSTHD